ncbi:hypothetical protein K1719_017348 [Acacia pycnantha]|nr:hypothetical protein K1719_017348 [Acacia pycnantha]
MYILELLGFQGLLYIFLLVTFLVIRHMWKNAEVKKEEIIRLVDLAYQEAAFVEMEASVDSSFVPASRGHQCAVCYSPTTMRCSKCKAVRYCSGKCQIIHWREGHKDECSPPIISVPFKEESNSYRVAVSETQSDAYDSEETHAGTASSNNSYSSFNPSVAEGKSSDIDSRSRLAKPTCHNIAEASSHTIEAVPTTSHPIDSRSPVNIENKRSSASKKNKTNSSHIADDTAVKSKLPKTMTDKSHDAAANLVSPVHKGKVSTVEKSATDASKGRPLPSMDYSSSEATADNAEGSHISKHKEVRKSPNGAHVLSSATKGDLLLHTKSVRSENYHALPAKEGGMQNLQQNVRNGLKTSVRKVVQQFRSSRDSASSLASAENEMGFPYEFFTKLYCYDKVELYPFGLTNCGNSCYANAVL